MHASTILSPLCPEAQGNAHIFTHTPQINQRHHKAKTDTLRSAWRQKETTCSQTRTLLGTITHTHRDTGTEPETQRQLMNVGAGRPADASTCRNTKTGLCLGTRAPLTPPAHRHSHMLEQHALAAHLVQPLFGQRDLQGHLAGARLRLRQHWSPVGANTATMWLQGHSAQATRLECWTVGMKLGSSEVSPPNLDLFV